MLTFNTTIKDESHKSHVLSIVASVCQTIVKNKISPNFWDDVISHTSKFFKKTNFPINKKDLITEFSKIKNNTFNSFQNNFDSSKITIQKAFYNIIDWIAYVNKNSSLMLAVIDKKMKMRKELSSTIGNIHSFLEDTQSSSINPNSFNNVINNALIYNNYVKHPTPK